MPEFVIDKIHSMTATPDAGIFSLDMTVIVDGVKERNPFTYNRDDHHGLGQMVKAFIAERNIAVIPYSAPPQSEPIYRIAKTTAWIRMTDEEADIMEQSLLASTAKERQMYAAAQYLSSGDPLWMTLKEKLTAAFGAGRAEELLARE